MWKDRRELLLVFVESSLLFPLQQKKSNKTNDREFVVKQLYQMALMLLWHQPVEKHLWPPTPKWSYDS